MNGDGFCARPKPTRQDHHRQPGGQVSHDQPAQTSLSDDHARPKLDGWYVPRAQGLADLFTAAQVLRRVGLCGHATQIDNSLQAGSRRRCGKRLSLMDFSLAKVFRVRRHAVYQIQGSVAPFDGPLNRVRVRYVEPHPLTVRPTLLCSRDVARGAAHSPTRFDKWLVYVSTHESRRAG